MGYGSYIDRHGRDAGYNIPAECDLEGCEAKIDRGMGYMCGPPYGREDAGCQKFFCPEHGGEDLCAACAAALPNEEDEEEEG